MPQKIDTKGSARPNDLFIPPNIKLPKKQDMQINHANPLSFLCFRALSSIIVFTSHVDTENVYFYIIHRAEIVCCI